MRRVLMIAYYFPPLGGIASLRAAKFARYLPDAGWEPTVVAPRNGAYYRDPSLDSGTAKVVRTGSLELSRWGKLATRLGGDDTTPARVGRASGFLRELARTHLYFPDGQIGWFPFALHAARRELRARRFDAVFSTSFPITAHLVARKASEEAGVPWVAEFRDPWAERITPGSSQARRAEHLERELLQSAATVVLPSPTWAELFAVKGSRRTTVITNGFDPSDIEPPSRPSSFVVCHLGTLYPDKQVLGPIWSALADLRRGAVLPALTIRFVGDLAESTRADLAAHGLDDVAEVTGFVPYRESLRRLNSSSLLILAGPTKASAVDRGHIAAKAFEYLGTTLPILYVGDRTLDVAAILGAQPGCYVVAPNDPAGLRAALVEAARAQPCERQLSAHTRMHLARVLAQVLEEVAR